MYIEHVQQLTKVSHRSEKFQDATDCMRFLTFTFALQWQTMQTGFYYKRRDNGQKVTAQETSWHL